MWKIEQMGPLLPSSGCPLEVTKHIHPSDEEMLYQIHKSVLDKPCSLKLNIRKNASLLLDNEFNYSCHDSNYITAAFSTH